MIAVPALAALAVLLVGARWSSRFDHGPRTASSRSAVRVNEPQVEPPSPTRRRVIVTAAISVTAVAIGIIAAVALGIVLASWPQILRWSSTRGQRAAIERDAPATIELLVLVIRSGLTPFQAVSTMASIAPGSTAPGFVEVSRRIERGHTLADALCALPAVLGPSMTSVADTLAIAERHGTPIGDALTQLSIEVRQRRRRLAEASARKLPVRLSFPLVFCTLPSFVLVAIAPAVLAALSSLGSTSW